MAKVRPGRLLPSPPAPGPPGCSLLWREEPLQQDQGAGRLQQRLLRLAQAATSQPTVQSWREAAPEGGHRIRSELALGQGCQLSGFWAVPYKPLSKSWPYVVGTAV